MIRRWGEQRIPQLLAICTLVAAVAGVLFLVPSGFDRALVVGGLVITLVIVGELDRRRVLDRLLAVSPGTYAKVDAHSFGAKASAVARTKFPDREPPYIARTSYDDTLDEALRSRRFVVVKGTTNSGKTRAAYEAVGRVLPTHKIVLPNDPTDNADALGEILRKRWLFWRLGRYVLVVNDLENRLSALEGHSVRKWLKAHPRSRIVATLSAEHWAELLRQRHTATARAATQLLDAAADVPIGSEFMGEALSAAHEIYGLPEGQTRLGAFLASAAQAIADFDAAGDPEHKAARVLALSGINCARAGLFRPIDLDKVIQMAREISAFDDHRFSDDEWDKAVEYCVGTWEGDGAILEVVDENVDPERRFVVANPALVERVERGPGLDELSPGLTYQVWNAIIELIADGPYDRLRVATAAGWRGRPDLAERLFKELAQGSGKSAAIAESRLKEPDRIDEPSEVTDLLERASIGRDPRLKGEPHGQRPAVTGVKSPVFDPTLHTDRRQRSFYERRGLRDIVRFAVLLTGDITAIFVGIFVAKALGAVAFAEAHGPEPTSFKIALVASGLVLTFFLLFGLYRADRERARLSEILKSTALAVVALSLWVIGQEYALINLPLAILAAGITSGLVYLCRWLYDQVSRSWVARNGLQSRVLLVESARPTDTAGMILNGCRRPMQMVGFLSSKPHSEPGWLGNLDALVRIAFEFEVDRVIIADPELAADERLPLIYQCHAHDLVTEVVPNSAELFQGASEALDDMVVPLVRVEPLYLNYVEKAVKRILDLAIALVLAIPAAIVLAAVATPTWIGNRRERLFVWDWRPGLGAALFPMPRLRTESNGSPTKLGALLERLRINELPQLLNVLEGTMSMVGPRPLTREEFQELDPFQLARYTVLPGITGLWQVARRKESSLEDMTNLDIVYCRKWTPLLDLTILLLTVPAVGTAPP